jgi:3-phosphoshikimate 1-carboxyvinyltransferase
MALPDLLPITPFTRPVRGEVVVPGSKSLTNRALLLAALSDRPVTLTGALFSEDTRLMAEALRRLGLSVTADEIALTVRVADQAQAFAATAAPVELSASPARRPGFSRRCALRPRGEFTGSTASRRCGNARCAP